MTDVVGKLWGFCNTLRHDGINYGDYIEQLTYLLFLKLADEKGVPVPEGFGWSSLLERSGTDLTEHYQDVLRRLGREKDLLGDIFAGALSKFREPVNLKKLILLINETEWAELDVDLKAEAYEGLLQKYAAEQKGAGQYFTPRAAIRAIVSCVRPDISQIADYSIHDPAVGTAGFLIAAADWNLKERQLDRDQQRRLKRGTFSGGEIVLETRRLALMNLYLHGIEAEIRYGDSIAEGPGGRRYNCILTNPPFGTKGGGEVPNRDDFTVATSNKQLNFVQHVLSILKPGGRAAMVLPDNVLFEEHAGRDVRQLLMEDCRLHTILRLPVGTFTPYSTGVKANVVFFDKGLPTDDVWVYDLRTNVDNITKGNPLTTETFAKFVEAHGPSLAGRVETDRFHRFTRQQIADRDDNLDIIWLKDEGLENPEDLPEPEDLVAEAVTQLQMALDALSELASQLGANGDGSEPLPKGVARDGTP
ncbi:MAG: type I restriction-modification system subunit M [Chloroflexi bacterium]|nr:type I restriction-modification system subunit M [Chloroflexota bacterium]